MSESPATQVEPARSDRMNDKCSWAESTGLIGSGAKTLAHR